MQVKKPSDKIEKQLKLLDHFLSNRNKINFYIRLYKLCREFDQNIVCGDFGMSAENDMLAGNISQNGVNLPLYISSSILCIYEDRTHPGRLLYQENI